MRQHPESFSCQLFSAEFEEQKILETAAAQSDDIHPGLLSCLNGDAAHAMSEVFMKHISKFTLALIVPDSIHNTDNKRLVIKGYYIILMYDLHIRSIRNRTLILVLTDRRLHLLKDLRSRLFTFRKPPLRCELKRHRGLPLERGRPADPEQR